MPSKDILLVAFEMTYTGSPKALLNLALALQKLGYRPHAWTFQEGPFGQELIKRGIPLEVVQFSGQFSKALTERISKYPLVIVFTVFCASFARIAQNYTETVLYLMEASNLPQLVQDCGLCREDIVYAGHLLCVSDYAKKFVRNEYGRKRVAVLRNYVEPWERVCQEEKRESPHRLRFLVSGTIEYRKGQDVAEEAFLRLPGELRETAELHFIGQTPDWSGDFREMLRERAQGNIFFHEEIQNQEILYRFYDSMDVLLVTSRDESCSLVALEAAMLGKPLLVTDRTGAQYITDKCCVLPAADVAALCGKMQDLILHRDGLEKLGRRNYRRYVRLATEKGYVKALHRYLIKLKTIKRIRGLIGRR